MVMVVGTCAVLDPPGADDYIDCACHLGKVMMIVTMGRFQPPHKGHEYLLEQLQRLAEEHQTYAYVAVSPTTGGKDNPLTHDLRVQLLEKMCMQAGSRVKVLADRLKTPIALLQMCLKADPDVIMIVGEDRAPGLQMYVDKIEGARVRIFSLTRVGEGKWQGSSIRALARQRPAPRQKLARLLPAILVGDGDKVVKALRRVR